MRISEKNIIKAEFEVTKDEVILIVLHWIEQEEKKPKVKVNMESLSVVEMRNIARNFVLSFGLNAVATLDPKLFLKKQDLLVACRGKFA